MDELKKLEEQHRFAMQQPFRMRITAIHVFTIREQEKIMLDGMVETGVLRIRDKICISGANKPDIITTAVGLMLASGPKNEIFPWPTPVAIMIENIPTSMVSVGMTVTRAQEKETL